MSTFHAPADAALVALGAMGTTLLVGSGYFYIARNATRKRRLWPLWLAIVTGIFGLWGWFIGGLATGALLLILSAPILMLYKSRVKFCEGCGRTVTSSLMSPVAEFCPKCGKPLK